MFRLLCAIIIFKFYAVKNVAVMLKIFQTSEIIFVVLKKAIFE